MRRYLLDTGIVSDFVNRRLGVFEKARDVIKQGHRIGVPTVVLGELRAGIELSKSRELNLKRLQHSVQHLVLWGFDEAAAIRYGELYAVLRRLGRPMQQVDIQVAAVALSLGNCTVVSKDSDLSAIPGLDVVDWSKA